MISGEREEEGQDRKFLPSILLGKKKRGRVLSQDPGVVVEKERERGGRNENCATF